MATQTFRVLVLDHTKLGESDTILALLDEGGSQLRGVAKGLRKSGSRFGASLEPYTVADVLMYTNRALPMITDARIIESNAACRKELERSAAAAVVASLFLKISQQSQEEPRVFDIGVATLKQIGSVADARIPLILAAFLFKVLAIHGYRPLLDSCACCGRTQSEWERFSASAGGVICPSCYGDAPSQIISKETLSWVSFLLFSTYEEIAKKDDLTINGNEARELLLFAAAWTTEHLGMRIKPLDFYLSLC